MTTPADVDIERESSIATTGLSRSSALGSHSPFATNIHPANELPRTHEFQSQSIQEPSTELRRATLPSIDFSPDEARSIGLTLAAHGHRPLSQDSMDGRRSGNIGFAVTSGSNPKRRSRSAGALRDAARAHRMSPIQWRRRSEEIKYWRESLGEQPLALPIQIPLDTEDPPEEPIVQQEGVPAAGEQDFSAEDNNRRTFDFGPLASSMQKQEAATLEERLSTLEVKLMDLEYAISKLQAQGSSLTKQPASGRYPRRPSGNDSGESAYSVAVAYQDPQRPTASGRHPY